MSLRLFLRIGLVLCPVMKQVSVVEYCEVVYSYEKGIRFQGAALCNDVAHSPRYMRKPWNSLYSYEGGLTRTCSIGTFFYEEAKERHLLRYLNIPWASSSEVIEESPKGNFSLLKIP